jgi:hypothetical protein
MYTSLLTARPALKNTGSLMPISLTASHNKTFARNLVLQINLNPLLLGDFRPITAVNREIGLIIHHTSVERFCREKVLRKKLQPNFDDGLWTWCVLGVFRFFGFAVGSHLCQILKYPKKHIVKMLCFVLCKHQR